MSAPELRPYQASALDAIAKARGDGFNRVLLQLPTGAGKTIAFARLLAWPSIKAWLELLPAVKGAKMLVIAHREELLDQAAEKIRSANPGILVSIEQGDRHANSYSDVIIASIQTLAAMKFRRLKRLLARHTPRVVVVDECFPSGTIVDGRPIEAIQPGDEVAAYDTETGTFAVRRVVRTMSRETGSTLLRLSVSGRSLVCTPNHRLWTKSGWKRADSVVRGDMMLSATETLYEEIQARGHGPGLSLLASRRGRAEGPISTWSRVDDVTVYQQGRDDEFIELCPNGLVYNLEVEGLHTYTANGFVVSNCHHASARTYRTALVYLGFLPPSTTTSDDVDTDTEAANFDDVAQMEATLKGWDAVAPRDRLLVGVTATPNRSDAIGLGCVFQTIAFSYPLKQAIDDGWLVPIVPWVIETATSLDDVQMARGDFNQRQLADAVNNERRNALAVAAWQEHAAGRSTIAFTVDVAHAHDLATAFEGAGVRARALSGETTKDDRREMLRSFSEGRIDVLANCMVLTEGTDLPRTSCILHAKPTKSATLYEQMSGRGLRLFPEKRDCILIDLVDVARRHSLQVSPVLYGLPPSLMAKGRDLREVAKEVEDLIERYPGFDPAAQGRVTLEQLQARAKTFDVWSVPSLGAFGAGRALNWIKTGEDEYRLQYPWGDGLETLTVEKDMLGHYSLSLTLRPHDGSHARQRSLAAQVTTADEAARMAEAFVLAERRSVTKLKATDAPWRKRPASEKQRALLQRMRVPFNAKTLTMGEASNLIDLGRHRQRFG